MPPRPSRQVLYRKLQDLYERMEAGYDQVAQALGHTCAGCPRNCCTSHFQHHTRLEWAYLHHCLAQLPAERQAAIRARAEDNLDAVRAALSVGGVPAAMCPLNEDGLCAVHGQRLMICRLHGVPTVMTRPDGRSLHFPGCWRLQERIQDLAPDQEAQVPVLDRTPYLRELAALEMAFLGKKAGKLPKVDLTLAEMIVAGPPSLTP